MRYNTLEIHAQVELPDTADDAWRACASALAVSQLSHTFGADRLHVWVDGAERHPDDAVDPVAHA